MIFDKFDFSLLNSTDFKEDSVREELISPLLHELGYKASGDFQILRGKPLPHPFVSIGSKRKRIDIIPDYLLRVKNRLALILDAKNPTERNIFTGKHVEQAYSYAIHPDVRVPMYALCNGHDLVVFHVKQRQSQPILEISLQEIPKAWETVKEILSPFTILKHDPKPINLYPDYGLYFNNLYAGSKSLIQYYYEVPIDHIDRINDLPAFSTIVNIIVDSKEYSMSLEFGAEEFSQMLKIMSEKQRKLVIQGVSQQPYMVDIVPPFTVDVGVVLGDLVKTKYEEIIPFRVFSFES
jgi:hypothetical protein